MNYLGLNASSLLLLLPLTLHAEVILPSGYSDIGAQINVAVATLPPSGGKIRIHSQANGSCYSFTVPIVISKAVIIQGDGPSTCLNFVGSGSAFSFSNNGTNLSVSGTFQDGFGLRDLTLAGTGPASSQVGLSLGGSSNSVGFYGAGLTIAGFGTGLLFDRGVWNFKLEHSIFENNAQAVVWPANLGFGGENVVFDSDTFVGASDSYANALHFNASSSSGSFSNLNNLTFISCNFDDSQVVIDNGSGSVRFYSPHFENANRTSGDQPFLRILAYTIATDVILDGPDFYNDQNNPYPPSFIEIDGGPTVKITQMRSVNLDGSNNVPTNLVINGDANVTLVGNAPLRGAKQQYVVASGNPQIWTMGGWDSTNRVVSQAPMTYSQAYAFNNASSPVIQVGGNGYVPALGFNLATGVGDSYYPMQIQENGPNELDFCSGTPGPVGNGPFTCNAAVVNGVFKSAVPDGTPPISVASHTPPVNLNAWPATFDASGAQVQNAHITTGKVILPAAGYATVQFQQNAQFSRTPTCNITYQAPFPVSRPLTSNPTPTQITIFGQQYIGVYFVCVGN